MHVIDHERYAKSVLDTALRYQTDLPDPRSDMTIEHFTTSEIPQPVTGNFHHAVKAGGFVFLAGAAPFDPVSGEVPVEVDEQIRLTIANLEAEARSAGASLAQAVRVGVYLRDMADFEALNRIYPELMHRPLPARTTIQSDMDVPIEMDAVLYVGDAA